MSILSDNYSNQIAFLNILRKSHNEILSIVDIHKKLEEVIKH